MNNCPFCNANRKNIYSYECGTLDNDPHPRTYSCCLIAYYRLKEQIAKDYKTKVLEKYGNVLGKI